MTNFTKRLQAAKKSMRKNKILGQGSLFSGSVLRVVGALSIPTIWIVLSLSGVVQPLYLPSPIRVFQAIFDIQNPNLLVHISSTLALIVIGYTIGAIAGFLIGLLMRHSFISRNVLSPIIETMRPVPAVALVPFFILWFGYALGGKILLVAAGTFLIVVVGVVHSIDKLDPIYIRSTLAFGGNNWKFLRYAALPAIMPVMLGHLRVALATAITLAVVSEFMGATSGLGLVINTALSTFSSHTVFLAIIILGIIGGTMDLMLRAFYSTITAWSKEAKDALS